MLRVEGARVPAEEIEQRLRCVMERLPRLKTDYQAQIDTHYRGKEALTVDAFWRLCSDLSLRAEVFVDWDSESFDEHFEDIVRIAHERGSHPEEGD